MPISVQRLQIFIALQQTYILNRVAGKRRLSGDKQTMRVLESALFPAENLQHVPLHVIPRIEGRLAEAAPVVAIAAKMESIFPAAWNLQLALRAGGPAPGSEKYQCV